jgi:hypothetical protein
MFSLRSTVAGLSLCVSVWLVAQNTSIGPPLAKAFDDSSSGPTIDEIAKSSQYALTGNLSPRLIPALPPSDDAELRAHAHYLIKGTFSSGQQLHKKNSYPSPYLINQASVSDVAIIGSIDSQLPSQLSENRSFLFTPFRVYVQEILFDKSKGISRGKVITIARPGGQINVNGVNVIAADPDFAWQQVGEKYVLYLHKIPGTAVYRIYPGGTFKLSTNAKVISNHMNFESPKITSLADQNTFLTEIVDAYKAASKETR